MQCLKMTHRCCTRVPSEVFSINMLLFAITPVSVGPTADVPGSLASLVDTNLLATATISTVATLCNDFGVAACLALLAVSMLLELLSSGVDIGMIVSHRSDWRLTSESSLKRSVRHEET